MMTAKIASLILFSLLACACSDATKFGNLDALKDKAPADLRANKSIDSVVKSIVPQDKFKCLDEAFNYMPDLTLMPDGSVQSLLNGSNADGNRLAFISASPQGVVSVVLNCSQDEKDFSYFTNAAASASMPKALTDWFYSSLNRDSTVTKSDGKTFEKLAATTFLGAEQKLVEKQTAKPAPEQPQRPQQIFITAGATICLDMYGMNKARAITASGNPHVQLPDSCVVMKSAAQTRIIQSSTPIPGVVIVEAGSNAVMIDQNDLSRR